MVKIVIKTELLCVVICYVNRHAVACFVFQLYLTSDIYMGSERLEVGGIIFSSCSLLLRVVSGIWFENWGFIPRWTWNV